MLGDYTEAAASLARSIVLFQELGDKEYTLECAEQFAAIAEAQGQADRAARLLSVCERLRAAIGLARSA